MPAAIATIQLDGLKDVYSESLSKIYKETITLLNDKNRYQFAIVLGDRIETFGFTLACFYKKIPIIHVNGGDIANVPYFDTNVRHSITKLAHVHLTTNALSCQVVKQLGEEQWRIHDIGNLSYDYDRLRMLSSAGAIEKDLNVNRNELIIIYTYHPSHNKSCDQNYSDFKMILGVLKGTGKKVIVTYPNNDPGGEKIIDRLETMSNNDPAFIVVQNLGTLRLLSLLKYFRAIVVGNSSSVLTETAFYRVPGVNIGERQTDRFRGTNVFDCALKKEDIMRIIIKIIKNYNQLRDGFNSSQYFFGDGKAALKAVKIVNKLIAIPKEELLFKKFRTSFS